MPTAEVCALIDRLKIPVAVTLLGLGALPASHPLNLGMMGMHGEAWVNTAIQEADLEVPRDISLMGYDNTALAALRHISLTTIHQPRRQIGEMAMHAVLRRIERPGAKAQRHVLAPKLVVRATTGKPSRSVKR